MDACIPPKLRIKKKEERSFRKPDEAPWTQLSKSAVLLIPLAAIRLNSSPLLHDETRMIARRINDSGEKDREGMGRVGRGDETSEQRRSPDIKPRMGLAGAQHFFDDAKQRK